jgi:hypothetical protein
MTLFASGNLKSDAFGTPGSLQRLLMLTEDAAIIQRKDIPRLVEIVGLDATAASMEAAGFKTLALHFITTIILCPTGPLAKSASTDQAVVERLARLGLMKSIVSDMRVVDRVLCAGLKYQVSDPNIINSSITIESQDLNPVYLFAARLALLSRVITLEGGLGLERVLESGLSESLYACCLDNNDLSLNELEAETEACAELTYVALLSHGDTHLFNELIQYQLVWMRRQNQQVRQYMNNPNSREFPWRYTIGKEPIFRKWNILQTDLHLDIQPGNSLRLTYPPSLGIKMYFRVGKDSIIL